MLTFAQAQAILERTHEEWRHGDLDGLVALFADDMTFWCNAGDPQGGPIEIKGKAAFRESMAAVLRTTRCDSRLISFDYDEGRARTQVRYRLERVGTAAVLNGLFRQVVLFKRGLIWRLEEYHDAARLTAFWQLTAKGAAPKSAVWDIDDEAAPEDTK